MNLKFRSRSVINPDVVDLEILPEDAECGRRVFLRPSERYNPASPKHTRIQDRERTWITAEDKVTQRLLRAEIFTDRIARFEVLTRNRDLRKDDIEVIGILAYDTEGNAFSTLDGLEFLWTVQTEPPSSREASHLLQLLPLKGSNIEASQLVLDMEGAGKQSGLVLAQAKSTGKVVVSARLVDVAAAVPGASSTPSTTTDTSGIVTLSQSVVLSILEPLNLVPASMIYVAPYATVPYVLQTIERDSFRNISMPNPDYVWSTTNPQIATVDDKGVVSTHGMLGNSFVDVRFTTVDDNHAHGHISVVEPHTIDLNLVPQHPFYDVDALDVRTTTTFIIHNVSYIIIPKMYDAGGNALYTTENVKFGWKWDDSYFSRQEEDALTVTPTKLGETNIHMEVDSIGRGYSEKWPLARKLEHTEYVTVVSPLSVSPSFNRIVLPYHPHYRHTIHFNASGGSGTYQWTTSARAVSTVTANGVLTGLAPGNDTMQCVDGNLNYNKVSIPVIVTFPSKVGFVMGAREAELDSSLILGIRLTGQSPDGKETLTFNNCSALHMSANLTNQEVFGIPTSVKCTQDLIEGGACACIQLKALRVGHASIKLFFDAYDPFSTAIGPNGKPYAETGGEKKRISSLGETLISVFRPVKVTPSQVILSHSASFDITIAGGPPNWTPDANISPRFDIPDPSLVAIEPVSPSTVGLWKYRLTCLDIGEQFIRISVGNEPSPTNPSPVVFHQSLKYACMNPHSLVLHPHNRAFVRGTGSTHTTKTSPSSKHSTSSNVGMDDLVVAHLNDRNSVCADDPFLTRFDIPNATFPLSLASAHYKLRVASSLPFNLTVLDESGRKFDNFSSLAIEWYIQEPEQENSQKLSQNAEKTAHGASLISFAKPTPGQDLKRSRIIVVADALGAAAIKVSVEGYDRSLPSTSSRGGLFSSSSSSTLSYAHRPALKLSELTRTYEISAVKNGELDPAILSLYHHPETRAPLRLIGGSGDFILRSNGTRNVALLTEPGTSSVSLQPVKLGVARITAVDTCLVGSQPSHSIVRVSDVYSIRVHAPQILQLGHETDVHFELLDAAGHAFDVTQLKLMDVKLHLEGDAIVVGSTADTFDSSSTYHSAYGSQSDSTGESSSSSGPSSASQKQRSKRIQTIANVIALGKTSFRAHGSQLGVSTISVMMTNAVTGMLISSTPMQIQVFPPLQVYPKRLELLPGATFQLETFGGPPTRSHLSFASSNHSIVSVSSDGVVTSKTQLGVAEIVITAHVPSGGYMRTSSSSSPSSSASSHANTGSQGAHQGEGNEKVWTETVQVVVKHLHGILIHSSTTRLIVGEEIVVRIVGLENESPFIWSGIDLSFQWEAVNPDVIGIGAFYEPAGVSVDEEQGQAVVVKALAPGTTRLSARLVAGPSFLSGKSASLAFEVVAALSLAETSHSPSSRSNAGSPSYVSRSSHHYHQRLMLAPHTRHSVRANLASHGAHSLVTTTLLTANNNDQTGTHSASSTASNAHQTTSSNTGTSMMQSDTIIQLDRTSEMIMSRGIAGSSVLQLQDKRDSQQLLIHVAVKPIHHVELRARTPIHWEMPVGSFFDFDIVLRDNLGQPFDSYEWTQFTWHFSRHDMVHAEILPSPESQYRRILRVKGVRPGTTMVQLAVRPSSSISSSHSPQFGLPTGSANSIPSSASYSGIGGHPYTSATSSSTGAGTSTHAYTSYSDPHGYTFVPSPHNFPTSMQHFHTIRVANAILPLSPVVHVGGVIHFNISQPTISASNGAGSGVSSAAASSTSTSASSSSGSSIPSSSSSSAPQGSRGSSASAWSSSRPSVVHIDPATGIAQALNTGKASVHHNTTVFTSTVVRSVEIATVEMDARNCRALSNIEEQNTSCIVLLTFRDHDGRELVDSEGVQHNIRGLCSTSRSNLIDATFEPRLRQHDNRPGCVYVAKKTDDPNDIVSKLTLYATASDTRQSYKTTNEVTVPFHPAFVIQTKSFRLSPSQPTAEIVVHSLSPIDATSRDTSRVTLEMRPQAQPNIFVYRIAVPNNVYPFSVSYIDFRNNQTKQTEFVGVSYVPYDDGSLMDVSDDSFFSFWTAVGLGSLTFGIAYIVGVVCSKDSS